MTSTSNRLLDEIAKLATDAAGVAQGVKREAETAVKAQIERLLHEMDMVSREEFDAVKAMAAKARDENESLRDELAALRDSVDSLKARKTTTRKTTPKKA